MLAVALALFAAVSPLALRVDVQPLGRGPEGTVVGVALQVAPEDRERVGQRLGVVVTLVREGTTIDVSSSVVTLSPDGSALLYREWSPGESEVRVKVTSVDGELTGAWVGKVVITEETERFEVPANAPPDALALELTAPAENAVHFKPPPRSGGVGALQLEVDVPEGTARVVFFQNDTQLFEKRRPPWSVSIILGDVARRTVVRAEAYGRRDEFLGEDAVVLNAPSGRLPVDILLGPEIGPEGERTVTVAVGGRAGEVVLKADKTELARWTECPCVTTVSAGKLSRTRVLSAEASAAGGLRGDDVFIIGAGGFVDEVRVEQVELPVVVFDDTGTPVTELPREAFTVYEDGVEVVLDGFGTTDDLPLSLGLVVDTSGSMEESFPQVRSAVGGFVSQLLRQGDEVFLLPFSWDANVRISWSREPRTVVEALQEIRPEGGTSLHDAVVRALEEFRTQRGRTALVLLTDGDDTTSRTQWDTALRFAQTMRTPVFPVGFKIGFLDFFIRQRLKALAEATGGEAFFAPKAEELPDVYRRISDQLRAQYLLSYRSPSGKGPDEFRSVTVKVGGEGLQARTIAGYYPGR